MPFVTSSDALVLDSSFLVARGIPWLSCLVVLGTSGDDILSLGIVLFVQRFSF